MSIRVMLIFSIIILTCSCVFAQDYEIRLTRPEKVGERYELSASGSWSEQMTMSSQGQVLKNDKLFLTATLEGIVTVLDIDDLKRGNRLRLLISKSLMSMDGEPEKEALPRGTQVIAQLRGEETEFLVDDNPVSDKIAKMLELCIILPTGQTTDDDIFGTDERKKVRDGWAMNSIKMAKDLSAHGVTVDAKDIEGNVSLEKTTEVDNIKCLLISAEIKISNMIPPGFPPGLTIVEANSSDVFSGEFPVDLSVNRLTDKIDRTIKMVAKGSFRPGAPEVTMSLEKTKSRRMKMRYLTQN